MKMLREEFFLLHPDLFKAHKAQTVLLISTAGHV
jgi:hypothetical protein